MINYLLAGIVLLSSFIMPSYTTLDDNLINMSPERFVSEYRDYGIYPWTVDDINYAALLVDTEVGSMGEDAAYSVLSTVEARFHSPNWCQSYYCSRTLLEEMKRPRQFVGPEYGIWIGMEYDDIDRESYLYVYKYILGYRGSQSCLYFEYFNSDPGGPSQCKIVAPNGLWTEFWSTESFEEAQESGNYRNFRARFKRVHRPFLSNSTKSQHFIQ